MIDKTAEQQARDLLERYGVEDAQTWSAGDLVELANLIAHAHRTGDRLLARRTLKVIDDFREAALHADDVMQREGATVASWSAVTSLIRRASALDKASEKLARSVLDE